MGRASIVTVIALERILGWYKGGHRPRLHCGGHSPVSRGLRSDQSRCHSMKVRAALTIASRRVKEHCFSLTHYPYKISIPMVIYYTICTRRTTGQCEALSFRTHSPCRVPACVIMEKIPKEKGRYVPKEYLAIVHVLGLKECVTPG